MSRRRRHREKSVSTSCHELMREACARSAVLLGPAVRSRLEAAGFELAGRMDHGLGAAWWTRPGMPRGYYQLRLARRPAGLSGRKGATRWVGWRVELHSVSAMVSWHCVDAELRAVVVAALKMAEGSWAAAAEKKADAAAPGAEVAA